MRHRAAVPLITGLVALIGACNSDIIDPATGSISALITGLPAGVSVELTVMGPGGFTGSIGTNGSVSGLVAGTYTITAPEAADGLHLYRAITGQVTIELAAEDLADVTFDYVLSSGILDVSMTGVPGTVPAAVVITGPNAFSRVLPEPNSVSGLPAGTYSVLAAPIDSSGHVFAPAIALQTFELTPSTDPVPIAVDYQLATGRALVNISGLPAGVMASVTITGPNAFSANLTASESLIRLAPGTYTVTVNDIIEGGHTFSAPDRDLTVIPSRESIETDVVYQQTTGELVIEIDGLPIGVSAAVDVTGPSEFNRAITSTDTLVGLEPGAYTIVIDSVNANGFIYEPLDLGQSADVVAGGTAIVNIAYAFTGVSSLDLTIPQAYLVQSIQRPTGDVPLVAGRDAMARIFVIANETNTVLPEARLRIYHSGVVVETITMTADRLNTPTSIAEQTINASWNALVPGNLVVENMSIDVLADPGDGYPEIDEGNNAFPVDGSQLDVDVRTLNPFRITLIPVRQAQFTGDITVDNADDFLDDTWRMFPSHTIDWEMHEPFTTSAPTLMSGDQNMAWQTVLSEIRSLRIAEGAGIDEYYYGVVPVDYTSGVAGLGYVPSSPSSQSKAAIGWDYLPSGSEVLAHELGHNFGRHHAPCGGPSGVDENYPYINAAIGRFGFDIVAGVVITSGRPDIMSYCNNPWVSDYTYEGILARREAEAALGPGPALETSALLVWGRITGDSIILEPAFRIDGAVPQVPSDGGPYLLQGIDESGNLSFSYRFAGDEVADLPDQTVRHFAFLIPINADQAPLQTLGVMGNGLTTLRTSRAVTGPAGAIPPVSRDVTAPTGVRLQWDSSSHPMILVRNAATRRVLSFARGGDAAVTTDGATLELVISDGIRSRVVR